ncbi:LacI family DNA-binding transcriptional regulator [Chthonomonas calidirosea]|uniref:LacI family DNA-binding transcriptional regulator n=1 Tax=Chthonomonas calidirosea TaxID=454171 RepID=UPI0006EC7764|nr:LacI family DNA-binding transcriptional regulator [Chthonomonas calidirosea]CEK15158.1 transcriptional regulator, LacI family [Chthonomonas calidirosea]
MGVTIRELAEASGVAPSTVSYVINNGPRRISARTRARVEEAMRRLNYTPNALARGLVQKRIHTIGVVFTHYDHLVPNLYFMTVLQGILGATMERNQNVLLFTDNLECDVTKNLMRWCDGRCDGLVIVALPHNPTVIDELLAREVPFVLVNYMTDRKDVTCIDVDNVSAARRAVNYLIEMGHKKIAIFCGHDSTDSTHERLTGYRQALMEAGLPICEKWIFPGKYFEEFGYHQAERLLALPQAERPTAVFCSNDELAIGALKAFAEHGVKVPEEISLIGFDDIITASTIQPPLTTMRQPLVEIGARATELLLEQIEHKRAPGIKELMPTELVIRGTVAEPPCR